MMVPDVLLVEFYRLIRTLLCVKLVRVPIVSFRDRLLTGDSE